MGESVSERIKEGIRGMSCELTFFFSLKRQGKGQGEVEDGYLV